MSSGTRDGAEGMDSDFQSDRARSLWAPILLGMMGNPRRRRRLRRFEFDEENSDGKARHGGDSDLDRELESITRSRRRNSAAILQLFRSMSVGMTSETDNSYNDRDRIRDRQRERVILINPFNQTFIVHGAFGGNRPQQIRNSSGTERGNRGECAVFMCLDDFEVGSEAKEMPCKHKFHSGCILPWLELHSSCPVCRYQIPSDESKPDSDRPRSSRNQRESESDVHGYGSAEEEGEGDGRSGRRFSFPWPFNVLFTSGSQSSRGNSSSSGNTSQTDEN
ncbi:RING/U-box superfamily protein [Hibiscus syriacus]|uniref:RING/U-box superfamily protein n=1 Tax=Hibiscus syriacus TaxID=106335 RepID=A0A6A3CN12_HIBSY|nr:RING/U-box superfamily protein [Hibiscus syriacus]